MFIFSILYGFHILSTAAFAAVLFYQLKSNAGVSLSVYDRIGWLLIMVLGATGMFQMSANPNYGGLLQVNSIWAIVLFIKHALIVILIVLMAIQSFYLIPAIQRGEWMKFKNEPNTGSNSQAKNLRMLGLRLEAVVFILILIATGVTRAA